MVKRLLAIYRSEMSMTWCLRKTEESPWMHRLTLSVADMIPFMLAFAVFWLLIWLMMPTTLDTIQIASRRW